MNGGGSEVDRATGFGHELHAQEHRTNQAPRSWTKGTAGGAGPHTDCPIGRWCLGPTVTTPEMAAARTETRGNPSPSDG
jgi:hypothetical protein